MFGDSNFFRLKIAVLSGLLSASLLVGFGWLFWKLNYQFSIAGIDREIQNFGNPNLNRRHGNNHYSQFADTLRQILGDESGTSFLLLVQDDRGNTVFRSEHWPRNVRFEIPRLTVESSQSAISLRSGREAKKPSLPLKEPRFVTVHDRDDNWRIGILGNDYNTVALGFNIHEFETDMNALARRYWTALPVVLILIATGSWLRANRALRPILELTETAERITARGMSQRIIAVAHDTEFQRLISVFNGMMDRLEKSYHQAIRFSSNASHELKTPLTIIQGELEQALHNAPQDSERQKSASLMLEEIQRLKIIVENLLLLSRADSGELHVKRTEVDLSRMLNNVAEDTRILAPDLEVEDEIETNVQVQADSVLLQQVFQNLACNAVKFNRSGGRIQISLHSHSDGVVVRFSNTGHSIPEEEHNRVFERFYRGSSPKTNSQDGTGLGLSLCLEIIRAHGGEVTLLQSDKDQTVFQVNLNAVNKETNPVENSTR